jgi:hypothetical protein
MYLLNKHSIVICVANDRSSFVTLASLQIHGTNINGRCTTMRVLNSMSEVLADLMSRYIIVGRFTTCNSVRNWPHTKVILDNGLHCIWVRILRLIASKFAPNLPFHWPQFDIVLGEPFRIFRWSIEFRWKFNKYQLTNVHIYITYNYCLILKNKFTKLCFTINKTQTKSSLCPFVVGPNFDRVQLTESWNWLYNGNQYKTINKTNTWKQY